jgi:NAD(P)H dehydrogenase (quinone)
MGVVPAVLAQAGTGAERLPSARYAPPPGAVTGSYGDPDELRRAFEGGHTLFLVSASETPDRVRSHAGVVDAAMVGPTG